MLSTYDQQSVGPAADEVLQIFLEVRSVNALSAEARKHATKSGGGGGGGGGGSLQRQNRGAKCWSIRTEREIVFHLQLAGLALIAPI